MTITAMTAAQTKADEAAEIYRLTNMVVREVSTVDRAANKRTFLTFKSDSVGPELVDDGKGGLTEKAVPAPEPVIVPEPAQVEQAKAEPQQEQATPDPAPVDAPPMVKMVVIADEVIKAAFSELSEIEKVGRKLSRERETKIRQAIDLLVSLIESVAESTKSLVTKCKQHNTVVESLTKQLDTTTANSEALKTQFASHVRSVATARSTVQTSKVQRSESPLAHAPADRVSWPMDMTRELHEEQE